jgi:retron-type reverse transcriptase
VVDLDLEKFFDRVNHDKLMAAIARRVTDKRLLIVSSALCGMRTTATFTSAAEERGSE